MAAIFSLLLQFYLNRQVSNQRLILLNQNRTTAYAMAMFTKDTEFEDEGRVQFAQGVVSYHKKEKQLELVSQLSDGNSYQFDIFVEEKPKQQEKDDEKTKETVDEKNDVKK
ncbi:MAG: competence type IV pilus minor pilin ComGG [Streptococcus sp.]|nr:competence type IV pilus minor pilin ComGG [Streptococcus sp.]